MDEPAWRGEVHARVRGRLEDAACGDGDGEWGWRLSGEGCESAEGEAADGDPCDQGASPSWAPRPQLSHRPVLFVDVLHVSAHAVRSASVGESRAARVAG